jgi:hypothetical protein
VIVDSLVVMKPASSLWNRKRDANRLKRQRIAFGLTQLERHGRGRHPARHFGGGPGFSRRPGMYRRSPV